MKKTIKQLLYTSLGLLALLSSSCNNNDDNTGDSVLLVNKSSVSTILDAPLLATQTVNEGDEGVYSFTVSIPQASTVDIAVDVKQISGSANSDDFEFDNQVIIPAYSKSATGTISILNDDLIEGDENFTLQIGTVSVANATLVPTTVSFTIKNFLSPDLEFTFGYNQPLAIPGVSGLTLYNVSAGGVPYDMDYFVLDEAFNDTGLYQAASSAEPEKLNVSDLMTNADGSPNASYLADGTYYIFYSLYSDATLSTIQDFTPVDVPTTVDYIRRGGIAAGTFVQEKDFVPTTKAAPGDTNFVISFTKLAGVYTLNNSIPEVIASGRSSIKDKLNIAVANARRNHKK